VSITSDRFGERIQAHRGHTTGFNYFRLILALSVVLWHSATVTIGANAVELARQELARQRFSYPERAQLFDDGGEPLTVPVRLKGIRIERSRQFGDVYLGLALSRGIGLEE
jgi:hypothetical protein